MKTSLDAAIQMPAAERCPIFYHKQYTEFRYYTPSVVGDKVFMHIEYRRYGKGRNKHHVVVTSQWIEVYDGRYAA